MGWAGGLGSSRAEHDWVRIVDRNELESLPHRVVQLPDLLDLIWWQGLAFLSTAVLTRVVPLELVARGNAHASLLIFRPDASSIEVHA